MRRCFNADGSRLSGTTPGARAHDTKLSDLVARSPGAWRRILPRGTLRTGLCLSTVPRSHLRFLDLVLVPGLHGPGGRRACGVVEPGAAARLAGRGDLVVGTPTTWHAASLRALSSKNGVTGSDLGCRRRGKRIWSGAAQARPRQLDEIYGATRKAGEIRLRIPAPDRPFNFISHLVRKGEWRSSAGGHHAPALRCGTISIGPRPPRFHLAGPDRRRGSGRRRQRLARCPVATWLGRDSGSGGGQRPGGGTVRTEGLRPFPDPVPKTRPEALAAQFVLVR